MSLFHGDCIEILPKIPSKSIDAIICDLPYGCTQNEWDCMIDIGFLWDEYNRIKKAENSPIILFGSGMFTSILMQSNRSSWKYNLIWEKSTVTGFLNANRQPLRSHEDILVFYDKQPVYNPQKIPGQKIHSRGSIGKNRSGANYNSCINTPEPEENVGMKFPRSVLHFDTVPPSKKQHPTEKPIELLKYLIKTYTNVGDMILDNCIGSGSTMVAAIRTKRNCIGIEKEKKYFDIALNRMKNEFDVIDKERE